MREWTENNYTNQFCVLQRAHASTCTTLTQTQTPRLVSGSMGDRRMTRKEKLWLPPHSPPPLLAVRRVSFPPQQGQDGRRVQAALCREYKCVWSLCRARESSRKLPEEGKTWPAANLPVHTYLRSRHVTSLEKSLPLCYLCWNDSKLPGLWGKDQVMTQRQLVRNETYCSSHHLG